MANSVVYWIHHPKHTDMFSQGYIGVSKNYHSRMLDHKRGGENAHFTNVVKKYGWDSLVKEILVMAEDDYCLDVEYKLRPQNCKWSTKKEQQRNRRITKKIIIEGVSYLICDIAEKYGFKYDTIEKRAKTAKTFAELVDKTRKVYKEGLALGGKASGAKKQAMTHCKYGHEFTEANTHIYKGWRRCRTCHRLRQYARTH